MMAVNMIITEVCRPGSLVSPQQVALHVLSQRGQRRHSWSCQSGVGGGGKIN